MEKKIKMEPEKQKNMQRSLKTYEIQSLQDI